MQIKNTADLQYLYQSPCKTDFGQIFVFWFGYTSKKHACFNGRVYGNSPRPMSKDCKDFFFLFFGGGIRGGVLGIK